MEFMYVLIFVSLLGSVVWAIASSMSTQGVKRKFSDMGVIAGRTKEDVIACVGSPSSISAVGDGIELLQWQITGYHIALKFTNGICDGVTHEFAA